MTTLATDILPAATTEALPAWTEANMTHAIKTARGALATARTVVAPQHLAEMVIVAKPEGRLAVYGADAWTRPTQQPMLPWAPPRGIPVATVSLSGEVTHLYA